MANGSHRYIEFYSGLVPDELVALAKTAEIPLDQKVEFPLRDHRIAVCFRDGAGEQRATYMVLTRECDVNLMLVEREPANLKIVLGGSQRDLGDPDVGGNFGSKAFNYLIDPIGIDLGKNGRHSFLGSRGLLSDPLYPKDDPHDIDLFVVGYEYNYKGSRLYKIVNVQPEIEETAATKVARGLNLLAKEILARAY